MEETQKILMGMSKTLGELTAKVDGLTTALTSYQQQMQTHVEKEITKLELRCDKLQDKIDAHELKIDDLESARRFVKSWIAVSGFISIAVNIVLGILVIKTYL
jgi:chromosome segregation ATPase